MAGPVLRAARLLDLLVRANLVQDSGKHRYDRHDLLRDYGRELADAAPDDVIGPATTRLLDHYLSTTSAALALGYPAGDSPVTGPPPAWLPDGAAARAWLTAEVGNVVAVVVLRGMGLTLTSLSRFDEAIDAYQESLALNRESDELHQVAIGLLNLGIVFEARGALDQDRPPGIGAGVGLLLVPR